MCFSQPAPVDHSAEIARQEEQNRQARILQGQQSIDNTFAAFDPAYFQKFQNDYLNYYNPQADQQFADARKSLRYNLARKGTLNSTPGQDTFAKLIGQYGDARTQIADNALAATNAQRTQVEQNKSDLYQQNTASADPSLAAQSAVSRANSLTTPPTYSPLADLFSGLINTSAAYAAGRQNQLPAGYQQLFYPGSSTSGSSKVVS